MQLDCIKICVKGTENRYIRYRFISIIRKSRRFLCPTYYTVSCLFGSTLIIGSVYTDREKVSTKPIVILIEALNESLSAILP